LESSCLVPHLPRPRSASFCGRDGS
jgi:hypothetical protein